MRAIAKLLGLLALIMFLPAQANGCDQAPYPVVRIRVAETPAEFDLTRSVQELSRMPVGAPSPYPSHYHTEVGGVMNGEIALDHKETFGGAQAGDKACVMLKQIEITLTISPTIYIASDFQDQTCWFREIFEHESKHVETDRALIKKYQARITDGLNMMLMMPSDYASGWIETSAVEGAQYDMQAGIENALEVLFNTMMRERAEMQREVDSVHEYNRIARACRASS